MFENKVLNGTLGSLNGRRREGKMGGFREDGVVEDI
jgi:hypothetical protein